MARYRKKKYGRRRSTNIIKMKFQSFMDISTSDESMQIITISAGGPEILRRLAPQFGAYKYYKIGNIAVKLVPASTLPVDPTGLSYEAGENTVDPRDQLTPGMMRITNGEDVFENISGLSADTQHAIYNNMLLDPRWFKWMLQSGVKRHATPRYWQIGQLHQDKWPGAVVNVPRFDADGNIKNTYALGSHVDNSTEHSVVRGISSDYGFFQTGHRGVLGWLPTDGMQTVLRGSTEGGDVNLPLISSPPEVEVMKIILPRAYKTKYFYRAFITETVYFREPIVTFGLGDSNYRPLDVFHAPGVPSRMLPNQALVNYWPRDTSSGGDSSTGGNYGDN